MQALRSILALVSLLGLAITFAGAESPGGFGPKRGANMAALLNIEAERAEQVEVILASARLRAETARQQIGEPRDATTRATLHAAMEAIRADMEQKLSAVLNPKEMAKLRATLPQRGEPMNFKKG